MADVNLVNFVNLFRGLLLHLFCKGARGVFEVFFTKQMGRGLFGDSGFTKFTSSQVVFWLFFGLFLVIFTCFLIYGQGLIFKKCVLCYLLITYMIQSRVFVMRVYMVGVNFVNPAFFGFTGSSRAQEVGG